MWIKSKFCLIIIVGVLFAVDRYKQIKSTDQVNAVPVQIYFRVQWI